MSEGLDRLPTSLSSPSPFPFQLNVCSPGAERIGSLRTTSLVAVCFPLFADLPEWPSRPHSRSLATFAYSQNRGHHVGFIQMHQGECRGGEGGEGGEEEPSLTVGWS